MADLLLGILALGRHDEVRGRDIAQDHPLEAIEIVSQYFGVAGAENVLMFGPPGVGETHLAIALGRAAVEASCCPVTASCIRSFLGRSGFVARRFGDEAPDSGLVGARRA